jgi:hypothetical protein
VIPYVERLAEPVDVLGDAELLDPLRPCGLKVALHVRGREVLLRARTEVVRAQVNVIIGEHRAGTLAT